jgi:hypothetical protein
MRTTKDTTNDSCSKTAYQLTSSLSCPQSAYDVYNLGISLHYCIRIKYLELEGVCTDKAFLVDQSWQQLTIKNKIEKLAAFKLNVQLEKFYDEGGPFMEDPVSKQTVKEIQPFFNRIMNLFFQSLDEITHQASTGELSVEEMADEVKDQTIETYDTMGRLFQAKEIENAFADLIRIVQS